MNRLTTLCCCVALLLAACKPSGDHAAAPAASTQAQTSQVAMSPAAAAPAAAAPAIPTLKVTTLDGAQYDLAAHRGKWVVVNFWATWCGPCLKEMPELSALDAMREQVEVIGLAFDDIQPAALKAFLQAHPVVYPIAIVDTYKPLPGFGIPRGLPTSFLIAPDGHVARQFLGPVTAKDVDAAIAAAGGPKAG